MTRKSPPLFASDAEPAEDIAAEIVIADPEHEPEHAPEPAPVADLRAVTASPLTTPDLAAPSAQWQADIADIERRIAEAETELAALADEGEVVEISITRGHDGADALAAEHDQRQERAERELARLKRARHRAQRELAGAEAREAQAERDRRLERARQIIGQELPFDAARVDGCIRALGAAFERYESAAVRAGQYVDVTGFSAAILMSPGRLADAFWHGAPSLATRMNVSRQKALPQMRPLAENAVRFARPLVGDIEVPNVTADAAAAAEPAQAADPLMGRFGGIVLTFVNTGGRKYVEGDVLSPEMCMSWPLKNRVALSDGGRVRFYTDPPQSADDTAALLD